MTGRAHARQALLCGYALVLLVPLALIAGVMKPGAQGHLVVFADALGFAALSLLALQIAISGRWPATTRAFGLRAVLALHRQAGIAVVVLVVVHVVVLVAADPSRIALLDELTAPPRARAGMLALVGLLVLAGTSAWRRRLGLSHEGWRGVHLAATVVVLGAAFAHVIWVDAYTSFVAVRWLMLTLILAAATALFWSRVARPYATALRPYRVEAVRRERGDAVTLELAPVGHPGAPFAPGQFARLRATAYGIDDHPFSLSSSARRLDRPAFTVKALGDFSSALGALQPGTEILVDGPHGEAIETAPAGRMLVVAGIGITPAISVIRTAAESGDTRPLILLYGSRTWEDVTFREELTAMSARLPNLRVVHVLSQPGRGWLGERGRIAEAHLRRHAPADVSGWGALVCGPPAMVATAARVLRELRIPVQIEGFDD